MSNQIDWQEVVATFVSRLGLPELEGSAEDVTFAKVYREERIRQLLNKMVDFGFGIEEAIAMLANGNHPDVVAAFFERSAERWIFTSREPLWDWIELMKNPAWLAFDYLRQNDGDLVRAILAAKAEGRDIESPAWLEAVRQLGLHKPPKPVRPIVVWDIDVDHPIALDEPLPKPPEIPVGAVLVLSGRGPIWWHLRAFRRVYDSPASAVACYVPPLGNVIVASHVPDLKEGTLV